MIYDKFSVRSSYITRRQKYSQREIEIAAELKSELKWYFEAVDVRNVRGSSERKQVIWCSERPDSMTLLILILTRTVNILAVLAVVCCEGSAGGRDGGQGGLVETLWEELVRVWGDWHLNPRLMFSLQAGALPCSCWLALSHIISVSAQLTSALEIKKMDHFDWKPAPIILSIILRDSL